MDLDVVATDSQGKPVPDLTQQDFTVKVGGQMVAIDYFTRVEEGTVHAPDLAKASPDKILAEYRKGPDAYVPRYFLIYVDSGHLSQPNRKRTLEALRSFITRLGPSDSTRLVLFDQHSRELSGWTQSKEVVLAALTKMESNVGNYRLQSELHALRVIDDMKRRVGDPIFEGDPASLQSVARAYGEEERGAVTTMLRDLDTQISTLSVLTGKKALIFVSGGFEMQPGAAMMQYANPEGSLTAEEAQSMAPQVQALVRHANASDITYFTFDGRGLMNGGISERAIDNLGHNPLVLSNDPLAERGGIAFQAREDSQRGLNVLANDTGGIALLNTNDLDRGLNRVYQDSSTYYSIGVNVSSLPKKSYSDVRVEVRRPGVTVRSRRGFAERSASEQAHDAAQAAILTNVAFHAMPVGMRVAPPTRHGKQDKLYDVPVLVIVHASSLTFLPQGDSNRATAEYFIGAVDDSGNQSDITRQEVSFVQGKDCLDGNCPVRIKLVAKKGNMRIVVNVRDAATGKMGTAKVDVHVE